MLDIRSVHADDLKLLISLWGTIQRVIFHAYKFVQRMQFTLPNPKKPTSPLYLDETNNPNALLCIMNLVEITQVPSYS